MPTYLQRGALHARPKNMKKNKGFTLIELLITIMLIGVLSGVLLGVINVSGVRAKSRDAQRVADLKKIQTALELYFSENRKYIDTSTGTGWGRVDVVLSSLSPSFINKLPTDPSQTGTAATPCAGSTNRDYWYIGSPGKYILATNMEVPTSDDVSTCTSLVNWSTLNCGTPSGNCYGVENPF